jgi:hypothetical protein
MEDHTMKKARALFAAVAIASAASLHANPPAVLPPAEEILARHILARGGIEKLHDLRSVIYRGSYHEDDHGFDMPEAAMALMRPFYKLVGDPEKLSPDFAEGYDGAAWEFYGDPGIVLRTVGAAAAAARHGVAIDGPLVDYQQKGSTMEMLGIETIDGRDTYQMRVRMRDGFEEDEFVDCHSWMLTASRKVAPIHAFGRSISTETRFGDFRPVAGVIFAFSDREIEIATGRVLNEMQWKEIVVNKDVDPAAFSPPPIKPTALQSLLDHIFTERSDREAVLWSYYDFRRVYPDVDSDQGIQAVGYQILKMGDLRSAISLLEANTAAFPRSSGAFFGLGRSYNAADRTADAKAAFEKAVALDPANKRARAALEAIVGKVPH